MKNNRKGIGFFLMMGGVVVVCLAIGIQLIPYGHDHTNPAVQAEPNWDSPRTKELAQRACFDCHSNETVWPWYSNIAPVSWLVYRDVQEGRQRMNLSEWNHQQRGDSEEATELLLSGEMPPAIFLPMHPEARLTEAEKQELAQGLQKSLNQ